MLAPAQAPFVLAEIVDRQSPNPSQQPATATLPLVTHPITLLVSLFSH